jgi:hypothetical protein
VLLSDYGVAEDEVTVGDGDVGDGEGLGEGELLADAVGVGVGLTDDGEGFGDGVGLVVLVGCGRPVVGGGVVGCETTVLGEADGVLELVVT